MIRKFKVLFFRFYSTLEISNAQYPIPRIEFPSTLQSGALRFPQLVRHLVGIGMGGNYRWKAWTRAPSCARDALDQ